MTAAQLDMIKDQQDTAEWNRLNAPCADYRQQIKDLNGMESVLEDWACLLVTIADETDSELSDLIGKVEELQIDIRNQRKRFEEQERESA